MTDEKKPRAVNLSDLTPAQRRLVLALVAAARAEQAAKDAKKVKRTEGAA